MRNRIRTNTQRFKDNQYKETFGGIFTDIHCHCLPDIDDGPANLRESIALCEALFADGIRAVVATPHFLGSFDGLMDSDTVRKAAERLNQILSKDGSELIVLPGAEVRVDERICQLLDDDKILTIGDNGRYILLELPREVFIDIESLLIELGSRGIIAVIGHPERNVPLMRQFGKLLDWVQYGAVLQITAASLMGDFGPCAEKAGWHLMASGLVGVIATDAHDVGHTCPGMSDAFSLITKHFGEDIAKLLCVENPSKIITGQDIKPVFKIRDEVFNK